MTHVIDISTMTGPERLILAQQLVDSVLAEAMPLSADQIQQVRTAITEIDSGKAICVPWDDMVRQIFPS